MTETAHPDDTAPTAPDSFVQVRKVLARTLGIEDREAELRPETELLGELPELDSLAVVELASALEEHFDIVIDDDDFTGEVFETLGSLAAFVSGRR
ncbi:acyl carrier protein [Nocardioides sp. zg-DK7169]|uniref:acyl carrier protein n=1 Tax=Nocardioides sp. zg-DK7169 TaxID=2736600 RepID=UPI0015549C99|nr:acyl carrier protein [Nocardioides sp. zg-DK7169]NPC97933.1 acyl carrier protein [Nocardioides sp. zg-DK7169]